MPLGTQLPVGHLVYGGPGVAGHHLSLETFFALKTLKIFIFGTILREPGLLTSSKTSKEKRIMFQQSHLRLLTACFVLNLAWL